MYRRPYGQMVIKDFVLPFEGKLDANNRWVKLAELIPWEKIEKKYAQLFPSGTGTVAKPLRTALGALIIKEKCGFTDRETVEQITENPYLQYFIGLECYQMKPPFDSFLMVHFRNTYRKKARQNHLKIAKQKKPQAKSIRKAIGKQLGYLGRNLKTIEHLLSLEGHGNLDGRQTQELETIRTLYQQQRSMYTAKSHQISDRIVSISQPHVNRYLIISLSIKKTLYILYRAENSVIYK